MAGAAGSPSGEGEGPPTLRLGPFATVPWLTFPDAQLPLPPRGGEGAKGAAVPRVPGPPRRMTLRVHNPTARPVSLVAEPLAAASAFRLVGLGDASGGAADVLSTVLPPGGETVAT
jgi:hypothetical protein